MRSGGIGLVGLAVDLLTEILQPPMDDRPADARAVDVGATEPALTLGGAK